MPRRGRACMVWMALLNAIVIGSGCQTGTGVAGGSVDHVYARFAVAADHPVASEAGAEMLRLGGNAVDAAVATSFCLSVVRPYSCGIGGGGFMVIHVPAREGSPAHEVAINYRERSPNNIGSSYYVKLGQPNASRWGVHASAVPGTVAGLLYALETYGTLDRETVLGPAIRAAEDGFVVDDNYASAVREVRSFLSANPEMKASAGDLDAFTGERETLAVGDTVSNPQQAGALRLIASQGADAFYRGPIADAIASVMEQASGPMTRDDLASYEVIERPPLRMRFDSHEIVSMPPPSSGGVALSQLFGVLEILFPERADEGFSPFGVRWRTRPSSRIHVITEIMKHAFADRAAYLADDAFVDVPVSRLTSSSYLESIADRIDFSQTHDPDFYMRESGEAVEDGGTSHLSVIDADGMAVACTETINYTFGSRVVVPGFGFMLNNEMDDFTTFPGEANIYGLRQSDRNLPAGGKRPLSSMSPTIVLHDGRVVVVIGASGGPRIISATFETILAAIEDGRSAGEAVERPRFHHQWMPNTLYLESSLLENDAIRSFLEDAGHDVQMSDGVGVVQMIRVMDDVIHAASDPRKGGRPAGE